MSTSVSTRTPGTLNPTRQQLDELDALLKRMLELPVNQLDGSDANEDEMEDVTDEPALSAPLIPSPSWRELPKRTMEPKPAAPPVSYMVVETASARPLPAASGFAPRPSVLAPRLLPVTPPASDDSFEEETPTPAAAPEPMPAMDSLSTEAETEAEAETEVWVPLRSTWQPSAQTWQPLADSWQQANGVPPTPASLPNPLPSPRHTVTPPVPDPIESVNRLSALVGQVAPQPQDMPTETVAVPTPSPVVIAPVEPRLSLSAEDAPPSVSPVLTPLVWFNQGFDACLAPLGEPGHWLSSPKGRQTLGIVGLLCLVAAAAVALSAGMGWTW